MKDKERLQRECKRYEEVKQEIEREVERLENSKNLLEKEVLGLKEEVASSPSLLSCPPSLLSSLLYSST
jgi:hypothetical protein